MNTANETVTIYCEAPAFILQAIDREKSLVYASVQTNRKSQMENFS